MRAARRLFFCDGTSDGGGGGTPRRRHALVAPNHRPLPLRAALSLDVQCSRLPESQRPAIEGSAKMRAFFWARRRRRARVDRRN
jgi:hypothetical protein